MKKVTKYEANNGELFNTQEGAEKQDLKDEINELVEKAACYDCGEFSFSMALDVILNVYTLHRRVPAYQPG